MLHIESIYLSKLEKFRSAAEAGAAKLGPSPGVFSDLLQSISGRIAPSESGSSPAFLENAISSAAYGARFSFEQPQAEIEAAIDGAARRTGLDEDLLRAVIQAESSFRPDAVSRSGAMGLMQLMPGTAAEMGVKDPFDPEENIRGGAGYLKKLTDRFGDIRLALAAYNTGQGRISALGIDDANDPEQYERISPRVRSYVDRVLGYWQANKNAQN